MGCDDGMGGFTAHREGRALQVSGAAKQRQIRGAVIDGKIDVNTRDPDPGHDVCRTVEKFVVLISAGFRCAPGHVCILGDNRSSPEFFVVRPGCRQGLSGCCMPRFVPRCLFLFAQ